jgi:outer membrane protein
VLVPSIDVGTGVTRSSVSESKTYYGSVSASLSFSPALFSSIEKTQLQYEAGKIDRETALRDVELSVRKAFYAIIYEREYVAQLEKSVETAQLQFTQTAAKQKAGLVPEVDLLSAQVALENLKPSLESARISLANDIESFKHMLGIEQAETISLDGSLDDAMLIGEIIFTNVSGTSSAVALLEKSLEIAKATKTGTLAGMYLPTVSLSYVYKPTAADLSGSTWTDSGYVALSASIALDNFLPFSSGAESIRDAGDLVFDLELRLADARISETLERESLARSIEQSRSAIKARKLSLTLAERNYELTNQAYRSGTKDILSLQDSADSLKEARVALLKDSYALLSAVLDLEYAMSVPFGTLGR